MRRSVARLLIALVASAALAAVVSPAALAATIDVTTTTDAMSDDGHCSLREAIIAANTDALVFLGAGECEPGRGADIVSLPAGRYTLTIGGPDEDASMGGDLDFSGVTDLVGAGATVTTIDANHLDRAIQVLPGATVTIEDVTITGGQAPAGGGGGSVTGTSGSGAGAPGGNVTGGDGGDGEPGGGILNQGILSILDSVVTGNAAGAGGPGENGTGGAGATGANGAAGGNGVGGNGGFGGDGGGIETGFGAFGTSLTVVRTVVSGNSAGAGGSGGIGRGGDGGRATTGSGGIAGSGTGGVSGMGGAGGGLSQDLVGTLTVEQSTISANSAGAGGTAGAGIGGRGGASGGDFAGPGGPGVGGGARPGGASGGISAGGDATLTDDLLVGNVSGDGGTGGRGAGGAGGGDSGIGGDGGLGGDGMGGHGGSGGDAGAITAGGLLAAGSLEATDDTFTGNATGVGGSGGSGDGGAGGSGPPTGTGGDGGHGTGGAGANGGARGGVYVGTATLVHVTITANGVGEGGQPGSAFAGLPGTGGIGGTPGTASLGAPGQPGTIGGLNSGMATTLQNSIVAGNSAPSCSGAITDGGHDITFPDAACPGVIVDPQLGPLADNGGPTETQALEPGSPALDAVPPAGAGCAATDQRGVGRPQGAGCDIGAYESAPPGVFTGSATGIAATVAMLDGRLNTNAQRTSYHFDYGTTTSYGSSTAPQQAVPSLTSATVSDTLSGLAPATTYHYRLVASNADGTSHGADQTFTTTAGAGGAGAGSGAPRFLSASVRPPVFAVRRGRRARPHRRHQPQIGTTFRYSLSEPARVAFTIERMLPGRRVAQACQPRSQRNRKGRACTRLGPAGQFAVNAVAGPNATKFTGRIGRSTLAPGRYRVTLVATDAVGRRSPAKLLAFRVVLR